MKYNPNPMQTDDITLSDDLVALTELIASNVHDVWAAGRVKEGWTYGKVKDTEKKTTPCLVPYDELPESEKEYDRNTAMETLKLITKLGYVITKKWLICHSAPSNESSAHSNNSPTFHLHSVVCGTL